jgi:hypothetical protein
MHRTLRYSSHLAVLVTRAKSLEAYTYTQCSKWTGIAYRNFFLFPNFILAYYYSPLSVSILLTVYPCLAFKEYSGTSKFSLRGLLVQRDDFERSHSELTAATVGFYFKTKISSAFCSASVICSGIIYASHSLTMVPINTFMCHVRNVNSVWLFQSQHSSCICKILQLHTQRGLVVCVCTCVCVCVCVCVYI